MESKFRTWKWTDWESSRDLRRKLGNQVAPETIRRTSSSSDPKLKKQFGGKRGPEFSRPIEQADLPLAQRSKIL